MLCVSMEIIGIQGYNSSVVFGVARLVSCRRFSGKQRICDRGTSILGMLQNTSTVVLSIDSTYTGPVYGRDFNGGAAVNPPRTRRSFDRRLSGMSNRLKRMVAVCAPVHQWSVAALAADSTFSSTVNEDSSSPAAREVLGIVNPLSWSEDIEKAKYHYMDHTSDVLTDQNGSSASLFESYESEIDSVAHCEAVEESSKDDSDGNRPAEKCELVAELALSGDDLKVQEYPGKADDNPLKALKESLLNLAGGDDGKQISLSEVGGFLKTGRKAGEAQVPEFGESMYEVKEGVSPLHQRTSTELTMQHPQLMRISTDVKYLVFAFSFFGVVRICEALLNTFSSSPPDYQRLKELLNALDPATIAWLVHNLRKPILGMLEVDPINLEQVTMLKADLWEELHKFFERQWKVMATLAVARTLAIVASHIPTSEEATKHVKYVWDALMALPVF